MLPAVYDTIEIELPAAPGREYRVFADPCSKSRAWTSLTQPCRVPYGTRVAARAVRVEVVPWSGDDLREQFLQAASFAFRLGVTPLIKLPLRDAVATVCTLPDGTVIDDQRDFEAQIEVASFSPFSAPSVEEFVEHHSVVETQVLRWPPAAVRLARRLNVPLPTREHRHTHWIPVTRALKGSVLVRVDIEGPVTRSDPT